MLGNWSVNGQGLSASTSDPALASNLYTNGYYLLSALEWSRVVVAARDEDRAGAAKIEMAYSFWKMEDDKAAYRILDSLVGQTNLSSKTRAHALSMKAAIALQSGDFKLSADAAGAVLSQAPQETERIAGSLKKCLVAERLVYNRRADAVALMRASALASTDLVADIESRDIPWKSPALSGTLSALVPGAGQTYCGRWRDGVVAFSVNGVLVGAAWECFDHELPFLGSAVVVAGLTWYLGNIYSAINVAHKHNDETLAATVTDWLRKLEIGLDEKSLRAGFRFSF